MRLSIVSILVLLTMLAASVQARAQETRHDQIAAANARAMEALRQQVSHASIGDNLTVQDLLDRTHGTDTLMKTLSRAQQIGGPRRIDEHTYQVRLDISGARVRQSLIQIATAEPKKSPVDAKLLSGRLANWDDRTFSATGTSAVGSAVDAVRPTDGSGAWADVPDDARCAAIKAARQNAAAQVIESIRPIPLAAGKVVGDVIDVASVHDALEKWLMSRPVTQVEFGDDLQVHLTLIAPGDELFDTFRAAATAQKQVTVPTDEAIWSRVRQSFVARAEAVAGRGVARAGAVTKPAVAVQLPKSPPDWVNQQIDAEGSGLVKDNRLKSARAAEADAAEKLRQKLASLPLTENLTLGQAAKQDPRIAAAITRSLSKAQPAKPQYLPDGTAKTRLTLDLRDAWNEIDEAL